jgi:hypothetical protein
MEGTVSEGELYRLQRAIERLMAGHREVLGIIDQEVEDRESSAQETLAEVQDILEGTYGGRLRGCADHLGGRGNMTKGRDEEPERLSREEDEERREERAPI